MSELTKKALAVSLKKLLSKKELSKIIYNKSNCKLVSNQSFNKLYKQMITDIAGILNKESNEAGEQFEINIDEF